jgi:hypothetical protein
VLKAHGSISIHRPLKLQAENEVQVLTSPGQKGGSPFRSTHLKLTIELRPIGSRRNRLEHWDVIQDEASRASSKSGLPMFGNKFGE